MHRHRKSFRSVTTPPSKKHISKYQLQNSGHFFSAPALYVNICRYTYHTFSSRGFIIRSQITQQYDILSKGQINQTPCQLQLICAYLSHMLNINKVHWVQTMSTQFHFMYTFFILYTMACAPQANAAGTIRFSSSKRQRSIYRRSKKRRGTCVGCTTTWRGKLERS